jgi:hypothetical protein
MKTVGAGNTRPFPHALYPDEFPGRDCFISNPRT